MRRALIDTPLTPSQNRYEIPSGEAKHLTQVLRLGPEDEFEIIDGHGHFAKAKLFFRDKQVMGELLEKPQTLASRCSFPIHLRMCIIKGDAMEWVVEKATELGVREFTPIESEFCVVKTHKKGADSFQERWQKIADQALKQSGRLDRMKINSPIDFETSLKGSDSLFWLDETLSQNPDATQHFSRQLENAKTPEISAIIGPEGGFSPQERSRLLQLTEGDRREIKRSHLGAIILRAETAALAAISMMVGSQYGKRKN